jgi:hypothetical protein
VRQRKAVPRADGRWHVQPAGGELQNWFPAEAATGRVIDHRDEDEQYTKADG